MIDSTGVRFPLSFAQQRLWFLDRFSPGSSLYIVPFTLRLTTAVDADALGRSLNEIVRRHEMLRTTFATEGGTPVQVVHPALVLELPIVDLQRLPASQRDGALMDLAAREAGRPFDLEAGPLLRATLFRCGPRDHLLLLVVHHIAADGWSLGLILGELTAIYTAFVQGDPSPLDDLPIQYADYAVWQRRQMDGGALDEEMKHWREQLAGLPQFTLPLPPPSTTEDVARRLSMTLPAATTDQLVALGRREGATLFMTLLAGFEALLHRYSGERDFALATVVANRTRAEAERLIGFFVNTLVLRANVQPDDTFRHLIRRVRETALAAYAHQELPFERLVEELRPTRAAGRNPLVQILFTLQNTPAVAAHAGGQIATGWELDRGTASFDLTCDLWNTPAGLESRWEYRADLFDGQAVTRLAGHYRRLLEAFAEQPDQLVGTVPLLEPDERHSLVRQSLGPVAAFPDGPLDRQIARVAAEHPNRVAAVAARQTLTHGELQAAADALGRHLRGRGVGSGEIIAILLPRTPWLGVAMLAILGAGAAFLTLDPSDPPARRRALLDDAGVRVVLTDSGLAPRMDVGDLEVVCVDLLPRSTPSPVPDSGLGQGATPRSQDAPAYCIYTSGSTGAPKGVLVSHAALANHCHAVGERYALGRADRVLQLAPVAFDVALEETLATWLAGAAVFFPTPAGALSFAELERCVERDRITVLNLPASYWHEWVDHLTRTGGKVPESLRLVVCGSERVSTTKLRQWQQLVGDRVRWINAYGVTEAAITSLTYEPPCPLRENAPDTVPIGRPLANVQALVLDDVGEQVPWGVVGELHLGGGGVALGYLGRPELSAERFVAMGLDPAGPRLYRTGDLVRLDREGELEFIGRRDAQVKIRGHRVDLGEIEAALMAHPAVGEAVVIQRDDGDQGFVGFVVPVDQPSPDGPGLTSFLKKRLPAHMVPATLAFLAGLPRMPNGKIDRVALPIPALAPRGAVHVPPRTALEAQLARLWASALGLPVVGVADNFFELGGHSLLATQLLSRVQAELGVELPLRTLFEAPTVVGQAEAITATGHQAALPGGTRSETARSDPASVGHGRPRSHSDPIPEDVGQLSDAEVDALLAELLAGGSEAR